MALGRVVLPIVVALLGAGLLLSWSASATESGPMANELRDAKWCAWDKRDGWYSNSRKCRKALKVYRAKVRAEGVFWPYGVGCRFGRAAKVWWCQAGKYRTTNIVPGEFSRGYVYRSRGKLIAVVTYPSDPGY